MPEFGCVAPGIGGFGAHLFTWFFQCDQNAAGSFLILNVADKRCHIAAIYSTAFYLDDDFIAIDRLLLH